MKFFYSYLNGLKPLLNVLYLCFLGMFSVFAVQSYMGEHINYNAGLVFIFIVFGVYVFNRFTDTKEDFANDVGKFSFFNKKKFLLKLALFSMILVFAILTYYEKLEFYHILLISIGLVYSYRLLPFYNKRKGFYFIRLKEIPFAKNVVVSIMWGTAVFIIPILFAEKTLSDFNNISVFIAALTISSFSNTLFCDIRDEMGDKIAKNNTLPVLFGSNNCYKIIISINMLWVIGLFTLYILKITDIRHLVFFAILTLYPAFYMFCYKYKIANPSLIDFLCESDLLIFAGGLVLLSIM